MSATPATGAKPYYYVPQPSYWPLVGSCALFLLGLGAALWMNAITAGPWLVLSGLASGASASPLTLSFTAGDIKGIMLDNGDALHDDT